MSILLWILSALLWSITDSIWKKAVILSKLPQTLFATFWPIGWIIIVYSIIAFSWQGVKILWDYKTILLVLLIACISFIVTNLYIKIYKNVKLSELLPYKNLDKIFIVLFWFILFYWTKNSTSVSTFIITLLTIFIIIWFNLERKKIKLSKDIILFIFVKVLESVITLLVWYIFLKYTTVQYIAIESIIFISLTIVVAIIQWHKLILLFTQEKDFYKYRLWAWIIWWTWFLIWLYIIETSWVLIATLISFVWLVFQILSMKFILNDTPEKKQIILASIVMVMIWIWYYFK
jgi:hypothetical protein